MTPVVRTEGLTKVFVSDWKRDRTAAVGRLDLGVAGGEVYGFPGPNGAGKTTTLKLLLGLLRPTAGRATILGVDAAGLAHRAQPGYLPESPYFYDYLTGREFLDFCVRLCGVPGTPRRERIARLLALVDLERAADLRLGKYSKGMLQRIGLAQALVNTLATSAVLNFLSLRGTFGSHDDAVFGAILVAVMLFAPDGILTADLRALWRRLAPAPRSREGAP